MNKKYQLIITTKEGKKFLEKNAFLCVAASDSPCDITDKINWYESLQKQIMQANKTK